MSISAQPERFSFRRRSLPVPGDLRIEWRVSLIVLMLGYSRARQASLAKLHILNDAVRFERSAHLLDMVVAAKPGMLPWTFRIEPAFARAVDFVVGDKLASWTTSSGRSALQLTTAGVALFEKLKAEADILSVERAMLSKYGKSMNEGAVSLVIGAKGKAE